MKGMNKMNVSDKIKEWHNSHINLTNHNDEQLLKANQELELVLSCFDILKNKAIGCSNAADRDPKEKEAEIIRYFVFFYAFQSAARLGSSAIWVVGNEGFPSLSYIQEAAAKEAAEKGTFFNACDVAITGWKEMQEKDFLSFTGQKFKDINDKLSKAGAQNGSE